MGDFVLFMPQLEYISKKYKGYKVTLLSQDYVSSLARNCPYIHNIITINKKRYVKNVFYRLGLLFHLLRQGFKICIYSTYSRELIGDELALWSCAAEKIGWDTELPIMSLFEKKRGDKIYTMLFKSSLTEKVHELERNKEFLKNLGLEIPSYTTVFWVNDGEKRHISSLWEKYSLDSKFVIALMPGASQKIRIWCPDYYKRLISEINKLSDIYSFLIIGSETEKEILDLDNGPYHNVINLCGKLEANEMVALLERCNLFVGNDSGPGHIAISVGIPTVCVVGGWHLNRFMPYGDKKRNLFVFKEISCTNCDNKCIYPTLRCMQEITFDDLFNEVKRLLKGDQNE